MYYRKGDLVLLDKIYAGYVLEGGDGIVRVKFYEDPRPVSCTTARLTHNHITQEEHQKRLEKSALKYRLINGKWGQSKRGVFNGLV